MTITELEGAGVRRSQWGGYRLVVALAAVLIGSALSHVPASAEPSADHDYTVGTIATGSGVCGDQPWSSGLQFYAKTLGATQNWVARYCPEPGRAQTAWLNLGYYGMPLQHLCIGFDNEVAIGQKTLSPNGAGGWSQVPPHDVGELLTHSGWSESCTLPPSDPPDAPSRVTVTGSVLTSIDHGITYRGLSGARYELWYEGKDGDPNSPVLWRPVKTELGGSGRVTGFLARDGRFELTFDYPQRQPGPGGNEWHGCEPSTVPFMASYACHDDKLVLRVYPENQGRSISVREEEADPAATTIATVPLGLFFQRTSDVHTATSQMAKIYRQAAETRSVWTDSGIDPGATEIEYHPNRPTGSAYEIGGKVHLAVNAPDASAVPHEIAHNYMFNMYGYMPDMPNCDPHWIMRKSSERCAWVEGFADFVATVVRGDSGYLHDDGTKTDLDTCLGRLVACEDGNDVEGRVAGVLVDLHDGGVEYVNGFDEPFAHDVGDILRVVAEDKPETMRGFYAGWRQRGHPEDTYRVFWMNTISNVVTDDTSGDVAPRGQWSAGETDRCGCVGGTYHASASAFATPDTFVWKLGDAIRRTGQHEILVRLPKGSDTQSPTATYEVTSSSGTFTAVRDQSTNGDGWVSLGVFSLVEGDDSVVVELSEGNFGVGYVIADAVMVAER
ncbi:hypothetical protein [Actinokineospora sp. HUAS TT18]|uniref:golvesin C-terminal-like domain-containing protein n=1 Tax=Actinokineospora sp. HUAS TT18 TaxID=3447451 RepID=UPI003F52153B